MQFEVAAGMSAEFHAPVRLEPLPGDQ